MNFLSNILIVASFTTLLLALTNATISIGRDSDINLMNFMVRSNSLLQQDPGRSLDCFNFYIPLINEIAKEYETNYKACINETEAAREKIDEATLDQRKDLASAADSACDLLSPCGEGESVEGIFQCFIDGSSGIIKIMYGINSNASQALADLREQYYLIAAEEYKCTNETKRVYEQKAADAYANLNSCILGTSEVPTVPPPMPGGSAATEQLPQTAEQPTPAPEQSTAASTESAEPETTSQGPESTNGDAVVPDNSENYYY